MNTTMHILKFIHLLTGMILCGMLTLTYALTYLNRKKQSLSQIKCFKLSIFLDLLLLGVLILMLVSGTLLIPLKSWTYHTPWIQAAFMLISIIVVIHLMFLTIKIKGQIINIFICHFFLGVTLVSLFVLIHDAVTKTTLL